MASNHTANYGLSQWAAGDAFVREEFNRDNAKEDAAVAAAVARGRSALEGLADVRYNVWDLALQNYYDGKQTGGKRAMIFDGFLDGSLIASLSGGLTRGSGVLSLQGAGMGDVELGYGDGGGYDEATVTVTAAGPAALRGFTFRVYSDVYYDSSPTVDYVLTVNGSAAASGSLKTGDMAGNATLTRSSSFSPQVDLKRGDRFTLRLTASGSAYHIALGDGGGLGRIFRVSSASGQNGRMTGAARQMPACGGALGWARYQRGSLSLSVRDGTGAERAFATVDTRETVNLQGAACVETSFRLEAGLPAGETAVLLDAALDGAGSMDIYDYGVVLL